MDIYHILFVYFSIVKLLLKPTSNSPTGLEDTKETSFCNISDDSSVTDPRKGTLKSHKTYCDNSGTDNGVGTIDFIIEEKKARDNEKK